MQKSIKILTAQEKLWEKRLHKTEREADKLFLEAKKEADKTTLAIKKDVDASLAEMILEMSRAHEERFHSLEEQTHKFISRIEKKEEYLPELAKTLAKDFVKEVLTK